MSSEHDDHASSTEQGWLGINDLQAMQGALQGMTLDGNIDANSTMVASVRSKLEKANDPGIHSLPTEVFEQVLSYMKEETYSARNASGNSWPVNEEYPLLKSMRLVSPSFNKAASRFLFRIVVLYEHPDRYDALNKIANTPYLAPLVESVQIANLGYLPDCCLWEEKQQGQSHDCRAEEACGGYEYWRSFTARSRGPCSTLTEYQPAGGPHADLDFSPEECYKRYVVWRDGERTMKDHVKNGTAPQVDLHLLPNLRSVDTVGLHEMRVIKRKPKEFSYGGLWTQRPETRRFYETGLIEENALKSRTYVTLCHLPTFIIAASTCGKNITCLTLHRLDDLFKVRECDNSNPALQLRSLRRLEIDLSEVWYSYTHLDNAQELAPWVHGLENLEELAIYQNGEGNGPSYQADVIRLIRNLPLPKLAKIHLQDGVVGFKVLKQFLSKHDGTIEQIEILDPFMEQERWDKLRERYTVGSPLARGKKVWLSALAARMGPSTNGYYQMCI